MKEKEELIHFETQFVLLLLYIIESFIGKNIEPKEQRVSIGKKALNWRITREYWKKHWTENNALVLEKRHWTEEQRVSIGKNIELKTTR